MAEKTPLEIRYQGNPQHPLNVETYPVSIRRREVEKSFAEAVDHFYAIHKAGQALSEDEKSRVLDIKREIEIQLAKYPATPSDQENIEKMGLYRALELIKEIFPPVKTEKPLTGEEQNRAETKKWILNFFRERQVPERLPGENIDDYLNRVHHRLLEIATSTFWNVIYDQSTDPYTSNFESAPTRGPLKAIQIHDHPQVYNQSNENRVKNFGSLCDQIGALFDDPAERDKANKFGERLKAMLTEAGVWHNRAVIINSNNDPKGPDGSLTAYEQIKAKGLDPRLEPLFQRGPETTESERLFSQAVEICMGIWSAMSLKKEKYEALKAKGLISADVTKFVDDPKYRVIPEYTSDREKSLVLIRDLINHLVSQGLSEREAQLAYHIGESYRIGAQIQSLLDFQFVDDKKRGKKVAKVLAVEGTPKALNIGYYVEGVPTTEARPAFNQVFADQLVHGYAPWAVVTQYSHGHPEDFSGLGDHRATIAEILAVNGAVEKVSWNTRSSSPDTTVFASASQAIRFLWARASIKGSTENAFLFNPKDIPLSKTMMLDREDEINRLQIHFGASGQRVKQLSEIPRKLVPFQRPVELFEEVGFDSDSDPISGTREEHIKALLKDSRDYLINAWKSDMKTQPGDFIRIVEFLFSRDDRPFVNDKMGRYITEARAESSAAANVDERAQAAGRLEQRLKGYYTYDLLLRSVFYLMQPNFASIDRARYDLLNPDPAKRDAEIRRAYDELDFTTWEKFAVQTVGGYRLPQIAVIMFLINQSMELRDLLPDERKKLYDAGYRLYDGPGGVHEPKPNELIFTRNELLQLAQEFNLGEGYAYQKSKDSKGQIFMQLQREKGHKPTAQYLIDRITLLNMLFRPSSLGLVGNK